MYRYTTSVQVSIGTCAYIDANSTTLGHTDLSFMYKQDGKRCENEKVSKICCFFIRIVAEPKFVCDDSKVGSRLENCLSKIKKIKKSKKFDGAGSEYTAERLN